MINPHEIEEAIAELERGSATYNNCMKLASLYIIRDEFRKKQYNESNYTYNYPRQNYARGNGNSYGYYPIYADNNGRGNGSRSYGYDPNMDDELMIRKEHNRMY